MTISQTSLINYTVLLAMLLLNIQSRCRIRQSKLCGACIANKCTYCQNSYQTIDGSCQVPDVLIKNCIRYNPDQSCKSCISPYTLQENVCVLIQMIGCFWMNSHGQCEACDGFLLTNSR